MAKREMPIWPTYVQGIVVVGVTGFGGYWLRHHAAMEVPAAIGISLIVGLIVGVAALYIAEWFYDMYADSIETKSRHGFTSAIIALIALAVSITGVLIQWHKLLA